VHLNDWLKTFLILSQADRYECKDWQHQIHDCQDVVNGEWYRSVTAVCRVCEEDTVT